MLTAVGGKKREYCFQYGLNSPLISKVKTEAEDRAEGKLIQMITLMQENRV